MMQHRLLISLLIATFIWSSQVFGYQYLNKAKVSDLDDLDELDHFLGDEGFDFVYIDQLKSSIDKNNHSNRPLSKKITFKPKEIDTELFFAILRKDSLVYRLETSKDSPIRASQKIIVRAKEIYYGGSYSYIYDKALKAVYKTKSTNLISIDQDVKLYPDYNPSIVYKKSTHYLSLDKNFRFENQINLSLDFVNILPLASYLESEYETANANSIEYKFFPKTQLPLDFGIGLTLQSGLFIDNITEEETSKDTPKWSAVYIGGTLRWNAYKRKDFGLNFSGTIKRSLNFELISNASSYLFQNTIWQLSTEIDYKTAFGKIALGMAFINQHFTLLDSGENSISFSNESYKTSNAFSLYIGHRFEVNL